MYAIKRNFEDSPNLMLQEYTIVSYHGEILKMIIHVHNEGCRVPFLRGQMLHVLQYLYGLTRTPLVFIYDIVTA